MKVHEEGEDEMEVGSCFPFSLFLPNPSAKKSTGTQKEKKRSLKEKKPAIIRRPTLTPTQRRRQKWGEGGGKKKFTGFDSGIVCELGRVNRAF